MGATSAEVIRRQRFEVAKARSLRLLQRFDPDQPRDEDGKWSSGGGGGGGSGGGGSGGAAAGGAISGFSPGVAGRGDTAAKAGINKWFAASPFKGDIQGAIKAAPEAQAQLGSVGTQIAKDMPGVTFKNPGVKSNLDRINEKVELRGGAEKVTDLARGAFLVKSPEQAREIADKLAEHFGVVEEDWKITPVNYADKALNLRFPNGLIGEMQIMDAGMAHAKSDTGGGGHDLYVAWREAVKAKDTARADALSRQQSALYGAVLDNYSAEWKAALGIGGR